MKTNSRSGFTLIEVLIVVVIMAILAATIIPQFSSSTKDAKEAALKFNLQSLRRVIELYKLQHNGDLPSGGDNLEQLTRSTSAAGEMSDGYQFGPYFAGGHLPPNPFTNSSAVTLIFAEDSPTATGYSDAGWLYNPATGEIWADHADYLNE